MSINAKVCVDVVLGGRPFAASAPFIGRRFLSALPMLLLVTIADNATARSGTHARIAAFSGAVLLGALAYAFAFHYTQPAGWNAPSWNTPSLVFLSMQFFQALPYGALAAALLFELALSSKFEWGSGSTCRSTFRPICTAQA